MPTDCSHVGGLDPLPGVSSFFFWGGAAPRKTSVVREPPKGKKKRNRQGPRRARAQGSSNLPQATPADRCRDPPSGSLQGVSRLGRPGQPLLRRASGGTSLQKLLALVLRGLPKCPVFTFELASTGCDKLSIYLLFDASAVAAPEFRLPEQQTYQSRYSGDIIWFSTVNRDANTPL